MKGTVSFRLSPEDRSYLESKGTTVTAGLDLVLKTYRAMEAMTEDEQTKDMALEHVWRLLSRILNKPSEDQNS
jgi:hypothetical protein